MLAVSAVAVVVPARRTLGRQPTAWSAHPSVSRAQAHSLASPCLCPVPPSSPSPGSYSSNVNLAVENSSWSDEQQLREMYLSRKSFAFNSDRPGAGGEMNR